ncbi:TRAF-type zinc finger protein [Metarhizium album ARSEF 1941]|uniref:TRAF-type zinc finger protein n=1 Tax=Metarhizium album (strain ARSEF 1941) TaxID=1081103 RepID=A0A0B2WY46_METAS|nr:TRAF-type zinc finger protein [Metarhizium album ARSEF 1941]KHN98332.1 TRAF-type zinc finger protein [Metarhizium album ARSEF 1941]
MSTVPVPEPQPTLAPALAIHSSDPAAAGSSSHESPHETTGSATIHVSRDGGSDSSDEGVQGVRMSPAAARRFARRNLRRATATPDLVTSLVRPPSPEAFYIAQDARGHPRQRAVLRPAAILSQPYGRRHSNAARERRTGPLLVPHPCSLDIPVKYGGGCIFDMHTLNYVSDIDPNLLCPICHDPLVDPVTTPCDHTFCYRCLRRSIASSPSGTACPIDRELLLWVDCFSAARLVRTQLSCLTVKCPNQGRGCESQVRRENVEKHATAECRFREYSCPDTTCDKKLRNKPQDDVCHHRQVGCGLCHDKVEEADKEMHLLSCSLAKTRCQSCWQLVCRSQMKSHHDFECDGVEVGCPYQDLGCPVRTIRGEIGAHSFTCAFHPDTPSGIVIRNQQEIIQSYVDLGSQLRDMQLRQDETAKRIDDVLADRRTKGNGESRKDAMYSDNRTMQDLDAGFEEVHQNLTHLEARQSMWTLNQVMPIREEVTELRNNINMIRMHVNWLLNRSREEGRIRAANNTGPTAGIRRDSSSDVPLVLSERRRSSSADMDVPRL